MISKIVVLLVYAFYNLCYALFATYFGNLADRLGKRKVLLGGAMLFFLVYLGFAFSQQLLHFIVLFGFYGLYMAATEGVQRAYVSELVPKNMKGSALGIFSTMTGLSQIIASLITGMLWDHSGAQVALLFNCTGSFIFILLLVRLKK